MNITLLLARRRLNLYEAASVVKEKFIGSTYDQALALIVEKAETCELLAEKIPANSFFNPLTTTVTKDDLQVWLEGIAPVEAAAGRKVPKIVETRIATILKIIEELGYDPLKIPYGGKKKLLDECQQAKYLGKPNRFTLSTFKSAWKVASKSGQLRVQNKETYKRR